MSELVDWARGSFDFVVIDSPPVVAVTDSSILAPLVDSVLIVVRADHTPRRAVAHGHKLVQDAGGDVIGAVLNDVPRGYGRYYGYGYGYGYYQYGYPSRQYGEAPEVPAR
jgi:Mrp family chromosome partitioning ATPase